MRYKSIVYNSDEKHSRLEFNIRDNQVHDETDFIQKLILFDEVRRYITPETVIITKEEHDISLPPVIYNFMKTYIFDKMREEGVKKIFFVMANDKNVKNYFHTKDEKHIKIVSKKSECI